MSTQKSIKLSEYIAYPYLVPRINLDFNIGKEEVIVDASMQIKAYLNYVKRHHFYYSNQNRI